MADIVIKIDGDNSPYGPGSTWVTRVPIEAPFGRTLDAVEEAATRALHFFLENVRRDDSCPVLITALTEEPAA